MMNLLRYCLSLLWVLFAGSVFVPSATWGYDAQTRQGIGYDGVSFSACNCDTAIILAANQEAKGFVVTGGVFANLAEFKAAEGTTALSPYRMTTAGETFSHYGYAEQAANFQGGLRPGGFATSIGDLTGAEAQSGLALRHATPPNAVYTVTPQPGTWVRANPVTAPQFGQPGGLPEFQFPGGTGPGTVSPPRLLP